MKDVFGHPAARAESGLLPDRFGLFVAETPIPHGRYHPIQRSERWTDIRAIEQVRAAGPLARAIRDTRGLATEKPLFRDLISQITVMLGYRDKSAVPARGAAGLRYKGRADRLCRDSKTVSFGYGYAVTHAAIGTKTLFLDGRSMRPNRLTLPRRRGCSCVSTLSAAFHYQTFYLVGAFD